MLPARAAETDGQMGFSLGQMRRQDKKNQIQHLLQEFGEARIILDELLNGTVAPVESA